MRDEWVERSAKRTKSHCLPGEGGGRAWGSAPALSPQGHTGDPLHLVGALGFALAALGSQPDPHLRAELLALARTQLQETGWEGERKKHLVRENIHLKRCASIQLYPPKILGVPEVRGRLPSLPKQLHQPRLREISREAVLQVLPVLLSSSAVPNTTAQGPGPVSHTPS